MTKIYPKKLFPIKVYASYGSNTDFSIFINRTQGGNLKSSFRRFNFEFVLFKVTIGFFINFNFKGEWEGNKNLDRED